MGKIIDSPLTDKQLEELGVTIPETETEEGFFNWFDKMEEEIFGEDEEWKALHGKK